MLYFIKNTYCNLKIFLKVMTQKKVTSNRGCNARNAKKFDASRGVRNNFLKIVLFFNREFNSSLIVVTSGPSGILI